MGVPAPLDGEWMGDPVADELRLWARDLPCDRRAVCALSVLAYVERCRQRHLRPSPRLLKPVALAAIWIRPGALERFARWAMAQLGCDETDAPLRGDVGLIAIADRPTAAICVGRERWAARGERGVVIQPAPVLAAWRVACPRR